uniref:THIF-type NAD/FAD binding fold domain-containing protein n=1 Tax=Triticum urartu TaxID=4572 RepID=A0A8R7QXA1_TRIUA
MAVLVVRTLAVLDREHVCMIARIFSLMKLLLSSLQVIGLGGVGSHAASMLLRSGVGRLLLVDFDQVYVFRCQPGVVSLLIHLYSELLKFPFEAQRIIMPYSRCTSVSYKIMIHV